MCTISWVTNATKMNSSHLSTIILNLYLQYPSEIQTISSFSIEMAMRMNQKLKEKKWWLSETTCHQLGEITLGSKNSMRIYMGISGSGSSKRRKMKSMRMKVLISLISEMNFLASNINPTHRNNQKNSIKL
jgi:hypothetical protein